MRPICSLLIYVGMVFVGGALLAPWLYWSVQYLAHSFPPLQKLAQHPFHRFVARAFLILAVAGLWPLLRHFQIKSWRDLGLGSTRGNKGKLFKGFALGFISLCIAAVCPVLFGTRAFNFNHTAFEVLKHLLNAVVSAAFVGCLEEIIFRGTLFGGLRKAHTWQFALVISSGIYALVHFFARVPSPPEVTWTSGLLHLPLMLKGMVDLQTLVPGLGNLMLVGLILGLAYQINGNLYFSIGLHAGWIFWVKSYGFFTKPITANWFWGTDKLIDGWAAFLVLILVLLVVNRTKPASSTAESSHAS